MTEFGVLKRGNRRPNDSRYCKKCNIERQTKRRIAYKNELVELAGGKCILCGYDRCRAAFDFHHVDPTTKEFDLSISKMVSKARVLAEAEKCVLLCANCHREVEFGFVDLANELAARELAHGSTP